MSTLKLNDTRVRSTLDGVMRDGMLCLRYSAAGAIIVYIYVIDDAGHAYMEATREKRGSLSPGPKFCQAAYEPLVSLCHSRGSSQPRRVTLGSPYENLPSPL